MRWKQGEREDEFSCCGCVHVRTGTLLLGLFHSVAHLLVVSVFLLTIFNPNLLKSEISSFQSSVKLNESMDQRVHLFYHAGEKRDTFLGLIICLGSMLCTFMLMYGTIKGVAIYLMPYFVIQVFDFIISSISIVGYFSYVPNLREAIQRMSLLSPELRKTLLSMDTDWMIALAMLVLIGVLALKAYLVGIVWSCYKYLTLKGSASSCINEHDVQISDSELLLPPKYEDVIVMPAETEENPPPPYLSN